MYYLTILIALAQINLGSFFLHPQNGGGLDFGLSQAANILGFGGDRSFKFIGNSNGVGIESGNGALVGGQRVGVDSGLGVAANRGVDLGSQLQFGNQPSAPHPLGQLGSFFDNARSFFQNLGGMLIPSQPSGSSLVPSPTQSPIITSMTPRSGIASPFPTVRPDPEEESGKPGSDTDNDIEDIIFKQSTERPRQLPGMIELTDSFDEE
ncbi:hypothetical protein WR25_11870 [Diploscapter pachys]|uniref:Uncharacterized protein n=1 Tax=Diploscapter pachys TaxID=2018661 RepID=A0A2A2LNK8_9BILA|nr:hypothetical protein WR25_11870 [Diploscapter pachys]